MTRRVLVLNGPNLNLLGTREVTVYGTISLDEIIEELTEHAATLDVALTHVQANGEGAMVDALHDARSWADGVVCNAGALTHYGISLRDAIAAIGIATVETHLSNVAAREEFRHHSVIAAVCVGVVSGFGPASYRLALDGLVSHLDGLART